MAQHLPFCDSFRKTGACARGGKCQRLHEDTIGSVVLLPHFYDPKRVRTEADLKKFVRLIHRHGKFDSRERGPKIADIAICISPAHHLKGNVYIQYRQANRINEAITQLLDTLPRVTGTFCEVRATPMRNLSDSLCTEPTNNDGICKYRANCDLLHIITLDSKLRDELFHLGNDEEEVEQ